MSGDNKDWATALPHPPDHVAALERIAAELDTTAPDILAAMVARVLEFNHDLGAHGLGSFKRWAPPGDILEGVVDRTLHALPLDIRPSNFSGRRTDRFLGLRRNVGRPCLAIRSDGVSALKIWCDTFGDKWELVDGYAVLRLL